MKTTKVKGSNGNTFLELKEGSCSVKIYTGQQTKNGKVYPTFSLTFIEAGKRQRQAFGSLEDAKAEAGSILTRLVNGDTRALGMRGVEIEGAALATEELKGLNVNLPTVAREYRHAVTTLNGKGTIAEAVTFFMKHAQTNLPRKTVHEVTEELWAAKKADGKSDVYLRDIKQRLKIFGQTFKGDKGYLADITTQDLEAWLRGLGVSPKHRNNYATIVTTLFNFAKRSGYLSPDRITAAENLSKAKSEEKEIEIYTPEELGLMLARVKRFRPELLPYLAIGAFAGIRPAELSRLDWKEIDFEGGHIQIKASKAKTARRRLIPIQPCLAAWLKPFVKAEGPVCSNVKIQTMLKKVVERTVYERTSTEKGVPWRQNALRHSYGSYRLPILNDAPKMALEMGNSPAMIFKHYRELVKPTEAVKFWALMPPHPVETDRGNHALAEVQS